jgi:biotin carboxyl carrier protein
MSEERHPSGLAARVRALAEVFLTTDLLRISVQRDGEEIALGRNRLHPSQIPAQPEAADAVQEAAPAHVETLKSDLVGIFHLSRPTPNEGDLLDRDRELAYVEALGIRNPVRSLGSGRIVTIRATDGRAVEYGQPLFEIDRG